MPLYSFKKMGTFLLRDKIAGRGFTIVELLIVIVIIAILAAITIVAYNGVQKQTGVTVLKSSLKDAGSMLEVENARVGVYPAELPASFKVSPGVVLKYNGKSVSSSGVIQDTSSQPFDPVKYPYYDVTKEINETGPAVQRIITSRSGVIIENACKLMVDEGYGKGPADWDSSVQVDYISSCNVYENGAIQIVTWQQFIDQNKLTVPIDDAKLTAYINAAKNYNNGAHPSLGRTVEAFINRLKAVVEFQGGNMLQAIFYDPSANQYWGVPKPTLPTPSARPSGSSGSSSSTYCIEGQYGSYTSEVWSIRNTGGITSGGC